jgi:ribosomal protein S12 methylthiotransferase accessory factor
MEGIELFHAESTTLPTRFEPYAAIAERHPVLPLEHLPLTRHSLFSPRIPERWTFGWDLIQQQRVAVPVDLVALGGRTQDPTHLFSFYSSSHGLACGATLVEAIVVGLLEVIEHDAVACWRVAADRFGQSIPRVRLETATGFPLVVRILDQLERARLRPIVYDCSVDTEVPVYWALLYDTTTRSVGVAEGSGAHVDPEVALVRALTEAAQARAVAIAGARDDCFGRDLMRIRLTDSRRRTELLESQPPTVDLRVRRSVASPAFGTDLEYLLGRLIQIGVTNVVAVELTQSEYRGVLSAVRVIVPMLAGPGFEDGHPSPRAEAFATRMAECS